MFDELTEKLRTTEASYEDQQKDYKKVEKHLAKDAKFQWKIPSFVVCMCVIVLFLLMTGTFTQQQIATSDAVMTEALIINSDWIPTSKWQRGVKVEKQEEQLVEFTELLNALEPIDPFDRNNMMVLYAIRFHYADGSTRQLFQYNTEAQHFYDPEHNMYYKLASENETLFMPFFISYNFQENNGLAVFLFCLIVGVYILQRLLEKKMRVEGDEERRLPIHSTHWQSVVTIVMGVMGAV